VLRAAGESETKQENISDLTEVDKRDPGFQVLTEEEFSTVKIFRSFTLALNILLNFPIICFISFHLLGYLLLH
jgi:hypothetical protein